MKFGITYNVFDDSLSLLEKSILSVRNSVEFINIVWQDISNSGEVATEPIEQIINDLYDRKLVDYIFKYKPNLNIPPNQNEVNKRNIGFIINEDNGCDFSMCMDSDEFYIKEQLDNIIYIYKNEHIEGSFCQMKTFYKDFSHQILPLENYYVSLFYKTGGNKLYKLGYPSKVVVDPTRSMEVNNNKIKIFDRNVIEMYHGSYVRTNDEIIKKFNNSSARINFNNEINNLINHYISWKEGEQAFVAGKPCEYKELKVVEDKFYKNE